MPAEVRTRDLLSKLTSQLTDVPDKPHSESTIPGSMDAARLRLAKYFKWKSMKAKLEAYTPVASAWFGDNIYQLKEQEGRSKVQKVEETIRSFFPKGRFPFQRDLHRQLMRATLRQTLGDHFRSQVASVCKEYGWDGPKKNLFAIASRRSGKTTGMASFVAAMLLCIPNIQIVVYSVALRTASEFVRLVERYIMMHPLGKAMLKNPGTAEMLVLKGGGPLDVRRIKSFPGGGNAQNVRIFFS